MKSMSLCLAAVLAGATSPTFSASQGALWPTDKDRAICDPIFASLERHEKTGGMTLMAQAEPEPATAPVSGEKEPTEGELADELSELLQACSYEGKALTVDPKALEEKPSQSGEEAVGAIMRFTGLPQNFRIMEAAVPNAAAMIVLGRDGIPQRVIAYNAGFMDEVRKATQSEDWSPLSIMAHEIGHHLSGHTLVPGGSQPPTELEADKFSGFVLYKMGAALDDAQKAIATLIPEADGPTHPGRAKRLAAVEAGWSESCAQQGGTCETGEAEVARAEPRSQPAVPVAPAPSADQQAALTGETPAMPDIPGMADIMMPDEAAKMRAEDAKREVKIDRVPRLAADATPSKFDRFIYDEVGVFSPTVRDKLQDIAFRFSAAANVEIVTIIAKDLQGLSPDEYALAALRQLRVGKLDVGNGAVLVVAPDANETGVALGPGLLVQYDTVEPIKSYLDDYLELVAGGTPTQSASQSLAGASYRIMRDTQPLEWQIRFGSLDAMAASTEPSTARRLVAIDATVVSRSPDAGDRQLGINEPMTRHVGPAMHVRTTDGKDAVLYVNGTVPSLMPVPLEEGRRYRFIARNSLLIQDVPQLDLISYDLLN